MSWFATDFRIAFGRDKGRAALTGATAREIFDAVIGVEMRRCHSAPKCAGRMTDWSRRLASRRIRIDCASNPIPTPQR
jgi:hypothetical protein